MLAFFDESGKFQQHDFICLCGLLREDEGWLSFIREWEGLLAKHTIPFFHTASLLSAQGPYRYKNWDHDARMQVVEEFIDVLTRQQSWAFAVGVDVRAYRALSPKERTDLGGKNPHFFALQRILRMLADKCGESSGVELQLYFDDDQGLAVEVYKTISAVRKVYPELDRLLPSVCFADDKRTPPLQAADLFANVTFRQWRDRDANKPFAALFERLRRSGEAPDGTIEFRTEYWDEEELKNRKPRGEPRSRS